MSHGLHHTFWLPFFRFQVNARNVGGTAGLISPLSHHEELFVRRSFVHHQLDAIPPREHMLLSIRHAQSLKGSVCPPRIPVTQSLMVLIRSSINLADSLNAMLCMSDFYQLTVRLPPSRASLSQHCLSICRSAPMPTRSILFAQKHSSSSRAPPRGLSGVQPSPLPPSPWQPSRPCVCLLGWYRTHPPPCN